MTAPSVRDRTFDDLEAELSAAPPADSTVRVAVLDGDLLFICGQVAFRGSELVAVGRLGESIVQQSAVMVIGPRRTPAHAPLPVAIRTPGIGVN